MLTDLMKRIGTIAVGGTGQEQAAPSGDDAQAPAQAPAAEASYVCNTNTHKFHHPDCKSVADMKPKNRKDVVASRDAADCGRLSALQTMQPVSAPSPACKKREKMRKQKNGVSKTGRHSIFTAQNIVSDSKRSIRKMAQKKGNGKVQRRNIPAGTGMAIESLTVFQGEKKSISSLYKAKISFLVFLHNL